MPFPALIVPLAAAAVQLSAPAAVPAPPPAGSRRFTRTFISPMGEPFRASVRGEDTLADWFREADRNHDGQITADEMQQDASRFFALLDTNHDGEIDPDEITHYEDVVAPEVRTGPGAGFAAAAPDGGEGAPAGGGRGGYGGHRGGHGHGGGGHRDWGGGENGLQGAARLGLLDLPEPVVAADVDFSRGITLDEFRKAALRRFQALDVDHQGRLTLPVLESVRPAPPPRPRRDPDAPTDLDPDTGPGG